MAIQDAKLRFSDGQAETTVAAHDSTNIINLGAGYDEWKAALIADYGEAAKELYLHVIVSTTFTSGGSATLQVALQDSADGAAFAATSPPVATAAIAKASLVAGYELLRVKLPSDLRQYVKLVYTIGTAAMTAGAVDAWIGPPTRS